MASSQSIERLQKTLSCLEENPPNWFGAAVWLRYALYGNGDQYVFDRFCVYVPDFKFMSHDPLSPTLNLEKPLRFMYAVQCGGYHQEIVKTLRDMLPKPDTDALVKEAAALRARIAALEAAMPKQLTHP